MAYAEASATNVFVPNMNASGNMVIGYSRNPKKFAVNRYTELRPVTQSVGKFLRWKSEQAARIINSDGSEFDWPIGGDRPTGQWNLEQFEYSQYLTLRKDFPFVLDEKTVDQADWAIQPAHTGLVGQQCMTMRTVSALGALSGGSWGNNASTVASITGASNKNWSTGTTTNPYILMSLQFAQIQINLATIGAVGEEPDNLCLVVGPNTAVGMAQSPEIREYLMQSPSAREEITFGTSLNAKWGLPNTLYGFPLIVEKTVVITSRKGAASTVASNVLAGGTAYIVSRPEGLVFEGVEGSPTFSTITGFFYEEMTVETFSDPKNRKVEGHVATDYQYVLTSPLSGFYFTGALG